MHRFFILFMMIQVNSATAQLSLEQYFKQLFLQAPMEEGYQQIFTHYQRDTGLSYSSEKGKWWGVGMDGIKRGLLNHDFNLKESHPKVSGGYHQAKISLNISISEFEEKFTGLMLDFDFANFDSARYVYASIASTLKEGAPVLKVEVDELGRCELSFLWPLATFRYFVMLSAGPYYSEKSGKFYVSLSLKRLNVKGTKPMDN